MMSQTNLSPSATKLLYFCLNFLCFKESMYFISARVSMGRGIFRILPLVILAGLFQACNNLKYLQDDEALLRKNSVEFTGDHKVEDRSNLSYELSTLSKQKPNRRFFGLYPMRLWFYNKSTQGDETGFKQWVATRIGEPPAVYDSVATTLTERSMEYYLNNKGYFDATVDSETRIRRRRARVRYIVDAGERYTIRSNKFVYEESRISRHSDKLESRSLLKPGSPVDRQLFDKERNNLTRLMRNEGYFEFYPNYIVFEGDSVGSKVDLTTYIQEDVSGRHRRFFIKDIYVHLNYNPLEYRPSRLDTVYVDGVHFIGFTKPGSEGEPELGIRIQPLMRSIRISRRKGFYRQGDYEETVRRLSALNVYRFVNVRFRYDGDNPASDSLNCMIYLTPGKKMEFGADLEVNTVSSTSLGAALGTAISLNYQSRNFFRGAEMFSVNLKGGVEYRLTRRDTISTNLFNQVDVGGQIGLTIPRFFPLPRRMVNDYYTTSVGMERSRLVLGWNYLSLLNFFTYSSMNASYSWDWYESRHKRWTVSVPSLGYFNPIRIEPAYQQILDRNVLLARSFDPIFYIGSEINWTYTGPTDDRGRSVFFNGNLDFAGPGVYTVERILQGMGFDTNIRLFGDLPYATYIKIHGDLRFYKRFGQRSMFATRSALGVGGPFGDARTMPYIKQFFVGGPNSIRGWRIRELGPGAYNDPNIDSIINFQPYQTGDVKLELSAEYRFDIYTFFKGALFLDAGNVWLLNEDEARLGAQLTFARLLDDIAVAGGVGFRFDYSLFVIRFDLGWKLRIPRTDEAGGTYWNYTRADDFFGSGGRLFGRFWREPELNLGIGYPF